ncbi:MAG: hypothetical protein WA902_08125 [Thermosynechococcaceae cyanobacterium]
MSKPSITYRRTAAASILELRHRVLRPGHSISEVMFDEDQDSTSRHYAAFGHSGQNLCCLSLLPSVWQEQPTWRLRTMATAEPWRNQGIGSEILGFAISSLQKYEYLARITEESSNPNLFNINRFSLIQQHSLSIE